MREQGIRALLLIAIDESALGNPLVARLMMLETVGIKVVGQRNEEVIVIVMTGAEKRAGLSHQAAVGSNLLIRDCQGRDAIGRDVQMMRGLNVESQGDGAKIFAGEHR